MDDRLLTVLERIATALERMSRRRHAPIDLSADHVDHVRRVLIDRHDGEFVTVQQGRDALGLKDTSAKGIGQLLTDAGFERHRRSDGVRFGICKQGERVHPSRVRTKRQAPKH